MHCATYAQHMDAFLADRYGAMHLLEPVLHRSGASFVANGDNDGVQKLWARENGMPSGASREDILLAQIEAHRADVFYNTDPMTFPSKFVRRLPATVKHRIAWRAAPSGTTDFSAYDLLVCNFPGILAGYRRAGLRAAYFAPAFDPEMSPYATNVERPIDVAFVGSFSRHHGRRTEILMAVAELSGRHNVAIHLDDSRLTNLAEGRLGQLLLPSRFRRPAVLRRIAKPPVFGRDLYTLLSRSKIVVNAAIDMAGTDRGNIRCFEAVGTGALLLSDAGCYPEGMIDHSTMRTYADASGLSSTIGSLLAAEAERAAIAKCGHEMVANLYSKARQWAAFQLLLGAQVSRESE